LPTRQRFGLAALMTLTCIVAGGCRAPNSPPPAARLDGAPVLEFNRLDETVGREQFLRALGSLR